MNYQPDEAAGELAVVVQGRLGFGRLPLSMTGFQEDGIWDG